MVSPKEKVEIIDFKEGDTKPTEFYTDKDTLIELIRKFTEHFKENDIVKHHVF